MIGQDQINNQPGTPVNPGIQIVGGSPYASQIPSSVMCAFSFIGLCNQSMNLVVINSVDATGYAVIQRELHQKQEAVFNLACDHIGTYFAQQIRALRAQEPNYAVPETNQDHGQKPVPQTESSPIRTQTPRNLFGGNGQDSHWRFR